MLKELFSETGDLSMMRFMALISLSVGSFIGIAGLYLGKDLFGLSALCGVFVTAAFGGKLLQRGIESKDAK